MELILLFVIFAAGFVFGWIVNARAITQKLLDDPERIIKILTEYKTTKETSDRADNNEAPSSIKVERHGETLYLFSKDTDEFLGQGSSLQEALDNVAKRFPNKNFNGFLSKDEADALGISVK